MSELNIQYNQEVLERFIPLSSAELAHLLVQRWRQDHPEDKAFSRFIEALATVYDAVYARELEELKPLYMPFNPDHDMVKPMNLGDEEEAKKRLIAKVESFLQDANFNVLDQQMLNEALNKTSPYGVEVSVDLSEFQETLIFYRGTAVRTDKLRRWQSLFLKEEQIQVPVYRRLFVLLQLKPENGQAPAPIYMKLFKDIPHSDLETIFPNTKVKMRLFDKIKLAVTGGGGAVTGIASAIGKLSAAANPTAAIGAVAAIGGIIWKQVSSVLVQRTEYMMQLAKNLYFYNLDNNLGAVAYLVELASAEEHKEALLGYYFLLEQPGLTQKALDEKVEAFVKEQLDFAMDYEVRDGLEKLKHLDLLQEEAGRLRVIDPAAATDKLKSRWVALFPG